MVSRFTQDFVKIRAYFEMKTFFGPHSQIQSIKLFVPPPPKKSLFMLPQSRYPGAGHDLQISKTIFRDIPQHANIEYDR